MHRYDLPYYVLFSLSLVCGVHNFSMLDFSLFDVFIGVSVCILLDLISCENLEANDLN